MFYQTYNFVLDGIESTGPGIVLCEKGVPKSANDIKLSIMSALTCPTIGSGGSKDLVKGFNRSTSRLVVPD